MPPAESDFNPETDVASTRVFAAPRERVYGAFADPAVLARWWGPAGFVNTFHEFDLRAGGRWRVDMRGPDGTVYANESVFAEVTPGQRVVFRHVEPVHGFVMTMTFADEGGGGTRVTWHMRFDSAEEAGRVRRFVEAGNEENFDRLGAVLMAIGESAK
ncbi:MAG TPA: SRPBCC family protein [Tepidisphaeraceae bacterium]|nr:SRPBCC family protein [Tepidisphaeraceae bacterium]